MKHLKEQRNLKQKTQAEVAHALGISQQAYANYESEKREPDNTMLCAIAKYFNVTVDYLLGREDETFSLTNIIPIERRKIPLLGNVACGEPIYAQEEYESYVECGADVRADFALRCKGDSMINARIHDGDIVFVRKQSTVENGQIAVVIIGDEATLKRFYVSEGKVILAPENPAYAPLVYSGPELEQLRILGRAIAFQSDIK